MNTTTPLRISATGSQRGFGTDRYKFVDGLTADERAAALAGERVYFRAARLSRGRTGTNWRVVYAPGSGVYPRVPTPAEVEALRTATGLN